MISIPRISVLLFGLLILASSGCSSQHKASEEDNMDHKYTNALINESSPYLLQHAHNPVNWYPWGDEALQKAKDENKLIIISVGYAACHWCHVMEHESFEDSTVAMVMNDNFVSIKVDREERPDVDQIYMTAVQLMTGSGGWPLNCIALPDGRPIWGGTYFPRENWMDALGQLAELWRNRPEEALKYADNLTKGINSVEDIIPSQDTNPFTNAVLDEMVETWKPTLDMKWGGRDRAPKFPIPNNWDFLMRVAHFEQDQKLIASTDLTLRKMAYGGIYDQVGGGFARYSVDGYWKVPHFEKMTYDNGQLVSLYSKAYQNNPDPLFKRVVYETLEYTDREMTSPEGGFYSSLDADSEGEEGKFYVWTKAELDSVLGADGAWVAEYYGVTERGNWEHGNSVLMIQTSPAEFAEKQGWSEQELLGKLEVVKEKLFTARAVRIRPGLDDKILTSWNALMLKGYVDAYLAFGEERFLKAATRNALFIEKNLRDGHRLNRNYKNGKASINAFLDDYALLADAYLALYRATLEPAWLERGKGLVDYAIEHFYSEEKKMFFYTSDQDPALIARKMELTDNVIPASNSVMANVLFDMSLLFDEKNYREMSTQMLHNIKNDMPKYGSGYSNWGILMLKHLQPYYEVVIAGAEAQAKAREFDQHYLPNILLVAAEKEKEGQLPLLEYRFVDGSTRIYVCQNMACQLPVDEVSAALDQMKK